MVKNETGYSSEELYRIYEYSADAQFPELDFRCGKLRNYVETGILTDEEVSSLWKMKEKKN